MEPLDFAIRADTSALRSALGDLERMSDRFGAAFGSALKGAVRDGREFDDVLRGLALRLSSIALDAAIRPVETGVSSILSGLVGGLAGAVAGSFGGGAPSSVPGAVPLPAMRMGGTTAMRAAPSVTLNVQTPDAASFRRSEAQIAAMLARTAARGRRSL